MKVKNYASVEEQLQNIKNKRFSVFDEKKCLNFLSRVNYYNLSIYFRCFPKIEMIDFENVCKIYEFDLETRALLFKIIGEIEIFLRNRLSDFHAKNYGSLGYLNQSNFNEKHNHLEFLARIEDECVRRNHSSHVIKHHQEKYDGKFPLWVIIEFFTTGSLSKFYTQMIHKDKRFIAREYFKTDYKHLENWLKCLTSIRNKCAHYSRLYFLNFQTYPKLPKDSSYKIDHKLFG